MKIDKLPELKGTTIKELQAGDCFTYPDTRTVLMKTSDKNSNNVVSLYNGTLSAIHEDTIVIPLPNAVVTFIEKKPKEWYNYSFREMVENYCNKPLGCSTCPIYKYCKDDTTINDLLAEIVEILDEI